ncbi:MAG: nucleotidyltransferase domain-containing protein [Candidatus Woesearchaeota archaeon]
MFEKLSKKTIKILDLFLDNPTRELYLREVAREVNVSPSTSKIALDMLEKEKLVIKMVRANASFYRLDIDNKRNIELKKAKNIDFILRSGFIKRIEEQNPSVISITLFGSFAKGTNTKDSDIDILIISQKKISYSIIDLEGIEINMIQFTPVEWRKKAREDRPFYHDIIMTGNALKGNIPEV